MDCSPPDNDTSVDNVMPTGWLERQLEAACAEVRTWPDWKREALQVAR